MAASAATLARCFNLIGRNISGIWGRPSKIDAQAEIESNPAARRMVAYRAYNRFNLFWLCGEVTAVTETEVTLRYLRGDGSTGVVTVARPEALKLPQAPQHTIRYWDEMVQVKGTERYDFDGTLTVDRSRLFSAQCSCGEFTYHGEEQGRRYAVANHKREAGAAA